MDKVAHILSICTVIISWQMVIVEPIRTLKLTGSKLLFADIQDIINKSVKSTDDQKVNNPLQSGLRIGNTKEHTVKHWMKKAVRHNTYSILPLTKNCHFKIKVLNQRNSDYQLCRKRAENNLKKLEEMDAVIRKLQKMSWPRVFSVFTIK